MTDSFLTLYNVIRDRQENPKEGSYTCYLFQKGLDKILKKCGEECAEVLIAAKNGEREPLTEEICDLFYHLSVLMAERGITPEEIGQELDRRSAKIGNLKVFSQSDHNS